MEERMTGGAGKGRLLLAAVLVLLLSLTACGSGGADEDWENPGEVVGSDWRTTGIVRDSGTITRDGEDAFVLVCVHASDAAFYYDTEAQTLFGAVDYPITLAGDAWEMYRSIDFADRNGDGNSDVAMLFDGGDGETLMVWLWDAESDSFVFRPEESQVDESA